MSSALTPDQEAFHAAWLGKLWPRYRALFEGSARRPAFEWRAALYPLWLLVPGVRLPVLAVTAVTFAAIAAVVSADSGWDPHAVVLVFTVTLMQLIFWPVVAVLLAYSTIVGEAGIVGLPSLLGIVAVSLVLGRQTPRWIVAEGRRRWSRHAARVAVHAVQLP